MIVDIFQLQQYFDEQFFLTKLHKLISLGLFLLDLSLFSCFFLLPSGFLLLTSGFFFLLSKEFPLFFLFK